MQRTQNQTNFVYLSGEIEPFNIDISERRFFVAPATPNENKRCITQMRRRFERWELTHLRELAASLHTQLEEAIARAENAEISADHWRDHAIDLQNEVLGAPDRQISIGLSQDGALHVLKKSAE